MSKKRRVVLIVVGALIIISILGMLGEKSQPPVPSSDQHYDIPPSDEAAPVDLPILEDVSPPPQTTEGILIGIEYALPHLGDDFSLLGVPLVKPLPTNFDWSKMQPTPQSAIDFSLTDVYVEEYQRQGFTDIIFGLRTVTHNSNNGMVVSKDIPVPKPEYEDEYAAWIKGIVERYDMDGIDDMPGLLYPIRLYEIEVEFSSYTPEPTELYLEKLEISYEAAHEAFDDVIIAHSAFLPMLAFDDNPSTTEYEQAFRNRNLPDKHHPLEEMRKVLDHPDLFDVVNIHLLEDPLMSERSLEWLQWEMDQRNYHKPIIVSDTAPTPFISYGNAISCKGPFLGVVVYPATESDRCRIVDYFNRVLDGDPKTVQWMHNYVAEDNVKKVVIAAEKGVVAIDTSFMTDLPILSTRIGLAGSGNAGFGGMIEASYNVFTQDREATSYRPLFYSIQQLQERLGGYTSINKVQQKNEFWLYEVDHPDGDFYIAWLHPKNLILPEDAQASRIVHIDIDAPSAKIVQMKTSPHESIQTYQTTNGELSLEITSSLVYVYPQ